MDIFLIIMQYFMLIKEILRILLNFFKHRLKFIKKITNFYKLSVYCNFNVSNI
jgi:hypothetical protein